jgi:ligand-binding sensor domain-containing protein
MKRLLRILILTVVSGTPAICQVPYFQEYFLLRKNEAIQVNSILQDKKGNMWIATSVGLFSFDGKNQEHYTTKEGLAHDVVTALAEDSIGRIWVGYETGQLGFFQKGHFERFDPDEGSSTKPISDILFDSKGNLWFSTLNDGLYYFTSNRLYRVDEAEGLPDIYIYDLSADEHGNIWAGTDGGAVVCTLTGNNISIDVINYDDGLPDNIIKKIVPYNKDTLLLGTEDAGILLYDLVSRKHHRLVDQPWTYGPISDFQLKGDKLWIACPQKGLLVYDLTNKQAQLYPSQEIESLALIRRLTKDLEGNIWIGTKSGLSRTAGDGLQFIEHFAPGGNTNVLAVTVDNHDDIWYSNSESLFRKKSARPAITRPLQNTPYEKYTVISLYTDVKGYVWAGLYGEGVLRVNPATGKIKHLSKELRNGNVLSITGDGNTVWLGTLGGSSKITFDENENLSITNFSRADGLVSDFIYQIHVEGDRVWFATDGKGVAMLNRDGFHHYSDGLPSAVVYGMAQDDKNKLWVNVQGHGLYVFDGRKFYPCDTSIVLRDKNIHSLTSDKAGNIIVLTDAGIDIIDKHQNKVVYLGEEVGVRDRIGNLNAVGRDIRGDIYFGTTDGIIKYTSEQNSLQNKPKPLLKTVSLFGVPLESGAFPTLDYDQNNITFDYVGLWYLNPNGLFYTYKLDNYDRDWITTRDQSATYSRLPPGNYTFRLRASNSQNFGLAEETTVSFSINPPIWQTVPFYICTVFALAGSIFYVIKRRETKLKRYNELLEEKVQMRTREIQLQTEEIQVQNEEISAQSEEILRINENLEEMVQNRTRELERKNKALEEYAFINAHKLRSPVATILGLINLISKTKLDHEGAEINRRLHKTADELDSVVTAITKAIERGDRKIPKMKDD